MCVFLEITHTKKNEKKMKYSAKFYLEKRKGITMNVPINLNVTYDGKRFDYYTGKRCDVSQWNGEKVVLKKKSELANGQSANDFNSDLSRISIAISDLFKKYDEKKIFPDLSELRYDLKLALGIKIKTNNSTVFWDRYEQYVLEQIHAPGCTIDNTRSIIKKLKTFKPDLTFENFNVQVITDFRLYLMDVRHCSENTVTIYFHRIKTFIRYAIARDWTSNNPFLKYKINKAVFGKPIYLTLEERDKVYNSIIEDEKFAALKDIFMFQSLVGCRIGDLRKFTTANIVGNNLEYIAAKTKDDNARTAVVPLTKKAWSIINKYNLPNKKLLPKYEINDMNPDLRILLANLGIDRIVTIPDKKTRQGKQVRICDIATTHMARRVFIGGLYKKGVKDAIIASMSGHVKDSKAFGRYYDVDSDDQLSAINLIE